MATKTPSPTSSESQPKKPHNQVMKPASTQQNPAVKKQPIRHHSGPRTTITINYDVGFTNALYLRGQGANLSWEQGIMLKNTKTDEWVWETTEPFTNCEFKVLVNDIQYETGDNHALTCGASVQYTPRFY